MAKTQFVIQRFACPVQEHDESHNLNRPELDAVDNPVRIESTSAHTISLLAARDWYTDSFSSRLFVAPASRAIPVYLVFKAAPLGSTRLQCTTIALE